MVRDHGGAMGAQTSLQWEVKPTKTIDDADVTVFVVPSSRNFAPRRC
jgi:hypothetical protein